MLLRFLDRRSAAWACAVALPLLMVALDPAVFRNRIGAGEPLLGAFQPASYVAVAIVAVTMTFFLIAGRAPAFFAGTFAGGALFATALGLALLPFSVMGVLLLGLGLLGLTPFLTGATLARWAYTQLRRAPARGKAFAFAVGLLLFVGAAVGVQLVVNRAVESASALMVQSEAGVDQAVRQLRPWRWLTEFNSIVDLWLDETDEVRKNRIATTFERVTGEDIEGRFRSNSD